MDDSEMEKINSQIIEVSNKLIEIINGESGTQKYSIGVTLESLSIVVATFLVGSIEQFPEDSEKIIPTYNYLLQRKIDVLNAARLMGCKLTMEKDT